ncbi:hypothetical protein ACIGO9_30360 [Nocardia asteroides]|uniref:hypothetical protein n=1 Tax=Nocardia asteroides TaxID=1824 RepID=UPI0037C5C694
MTDFDVAGGAHVDGLEQVTVHVPEVEVTFCLEERLVAPAGDEADDFSAASGWFEGGSLPVVGECSTKASRS